MFLQPITDKLVRRLDHSSPVARDAALGTRIKEAATQGRIVKAISMAAADVILTEAQTSALFLEVTTGHATNAIIAPKIEGKMFWVINNHATLATLIKVAAGTAVTIAATKKALVYCNGTDYIRLSQDQ